MRRLALPVVIASALALSGCVVLPIGAPQPTVTLIPGETLTPVPTPAPSAPDGGGAIASCEGGSLTLDQPGEYTLGNCESLTIEGRGVEVRARDVDSLTIRGDGNEVDATSIGQVTIAGQGNDVESGPVGAIDVAGDRNEVDVTGDIGTLTIAGNDNEVSASGAIGASAVTGSGNQVRPNDR